MDTQDKRVNAIVNPFCSVKLDGTDACEPDFGKLDADCFAAFFREDTYLGGLAYSLVTGRPEDCYPSGGFRDDAGPFFGISTYFFDQDCEGPPYGSSRSLYPKNVNGILYYTAAGESVQLAVDGNYYYWDSFDRTCQPLTTSQTLTFWPYVPISSSITGLFEADAPYHFNAVY